MSVIGSCTLVALLAALPDSAFVIAQRTSDSGNRPTLAEVAAQLDGYQRRTSTGSARAGELGAIATAMLERERNSKNAAVRIAACASTFVAETDDCRRTLAAAERRNDLPLATRVQAAAAQLRSKVSERSEVLDQVLAAVSPETLATITDVLAELPYAHSVPALLKMLRSPDTGAQVAACRVLGGMNTSEVIAAVDEVARTSTPGSDLWLAATAARARLGQPDALQVAANAHAMMDGENLLEASRALYESGDPRGVDMLLFVTRNQSGLVRLRAAILLRTSHDELTASVLQEALHQRSDQMRREALKAYRDYPLAVPQEALRLIVDPDPLVRILAAEMAIAWVRRQAEP